MAELTEPTRWQQFDTKILVYINSPPEKRGSIGAVWNAAPARQWIKANIHAKHVQEAIYG